MTAEQLSGWITIGTILVEKIGQTVQQVRNLIVSSSSSGVAEADLNAILAVVGNDARRRAEMARLDKAQAEADAAAQGAPVPSPAKKAKKS